jgi:glycosyltransferase involved in cell wall biosynthesis
MPLLRSGGFTTAWSIAIRRLREKPQIIGPLLIAAALFGFLLGVFRRHQRAIAVLSRVHRATQIEWLRKAVEPYIRRHLSVIYQPAAVVPCVDANVDWKRLLVLKPPLPHGEKGVLLVMFSEMLATLPAIVDLDRLLPDYTLVLEPSYPGCCHPDLLAYTRFGYPVFILCGTSGDLRFLQRLRSNLKPVDLAPCDWVDSRVAEPYLGTPKEFDIVMNAMWASLKRHYVLFRMLSRARRRYKVALIGVSWDHRTRADVEREAAYYGVTDSVTIFDSVAYERAMEITCKSRVSLLLSLKEAGPRSVAESFFCDVPAVVPAALVGGIAKSVVPQTGIRADEDDLESAIERLRTANIRPRTWAIEHISCLKSSESLNAVLRQHSVSSGHAWSHDIAIRANSPECTYYSPLDEERLRPYNHALRDYLRS